MQCFFSHIKSPLLRKCLTRRFSFIGNNCAQLIFPLLQGWRRGNASLSRKLFMTQLQWRRLASQRGWDELYDPNSREHEINAEPGREDMPFHLHKEKGDWTRKEVGNRKSVYEGSRSSRTEYLEGLFAKHRSNSIICSYFRLLMHQV